MVRNLTDQQIEDFINLLSEIKRDDEADGYKVNLLFANKCTTEEMMMRVAMSIKAEDIGGHKQR